MEPYDADVIAQFKGSSDSRSFLRHRVVQEVISAINMPIDERDRGAELNILTEYYYNAFNFAENEMRLENRKIAEVMNVAQSLTTYDAFKPAEVKNLEVRKPEDGYALVKSKLTSLMGVFTAEEIRVIAEYFVRSYLGNLRLWVHVLSGKHQTETKVATVFVDDPLPSLPLSKSVERLKLPKDDLASERDSLTRSKASRKSTMMRGQAYPKPSEDDRVQSALPEVETVDEQISKTAARIEEQALQREQVLEKAVEENRKKK